MLIKSISAAVKSLGACTWRSIERKEYKYKHTNRYIYICTHINMKELGVLVAIIIRDEGLLNVSTLRSSSAVYVHIYT